MRFAYSAFGRPDWAAISPFVYFPANALFIAAVWNASATDSLFTWRPLVWAGQRSYSIYLLHKPILAIAVLWLGVTMPAMAIGFAATLAMASLSWRFIEKPAQRWARAVSKR